MNKPAVHQITDTLGADAICAALNVTSHSVRGARTSGVFPASWYDVLQSMCIEMGIPCPRNAFNWKGLAKISGNYPSHANAARQHQGKLAEKAKSTPARHGAA
ncbi:hypothetical protein [Paracoccus sulfuroxidans]|uniref:hypothetical protein n=1 Tax=Paracoccus sulfuroxidans TaxID=384678 RepID=UPI0011A0EC12|nr:hypothetical protein [Paracoccus sulfuroxidans]